MHRTASRFSIEFFKGELRLKALYKVILNEQAQRTSTQPIRGSNNESISIANVPKIVSEAIF